MIIKKEGKQIAINTYNICDIMKYLILLTLCFSCGPGSSMPHNKKNDLKPKIFTKAEEAIKRKIDTTKISELENHEKVITTRISELENHLEDWRKKKSELEERLKEYTGNPKKESGAQGSDLEVVQTINKSDKIKNIERQIGNLSGTINKIQDFIDKLQGKKKEVDQIVNQLENDPKGKSKEKIQKLITQHEKKLDEIKNLKGEIQAEINKEVVEIGKLQNKINEIKKEIEEIKKQPEDFIGDYGSKINKMQEEGRNLSRQLATLQKGEEATSRELSALQKELSSKDELEKEIGDLNGKIEQFDTKINELKKEQEIKEKEISDKENEINKIKEEKKELSKLIQQKQGKNELTIQLQKLKKELKKEQIKEQKKADDLQKQQKTIKNKIINLDKEIADLTTEYKKKNKIIVNNKDYIQEIKKGQIRLRNDLVELKNKNLGKKDNLGNLDEQIGQLQIEIKQKKNKVSIYENKLTEMQIEMTKKELEIVGKTESKIKVNQLKKQLKTLGQKQNNIKKAIPELKKQKDEQSKKGKELDTEITGIEKKIKQKKKQSGKNYDKFTKQQEEVNKLKIQQSEISDLQREENILNVEVDKLSRNIKVISNKIKISTDEKTKIQKEKEELDKQLQELNKGNTGLQEQGDNLEQQTNTLKNSINKIKQEIEEQKEEADQENLKRKEEIDRITKDFNESQKILETKIKKLKEVDLKTETKKLKAIIEQGKQIPQEITTKKDMLQKLEKEKNMLKIELEEWESKKDEAYEKMNVQLYEKTTTIISMLSLGNFSQNLKYNYRDIDKYKYFFIEKLYQDRVGSDIINTSLLSSSSISLESNDIYKDFKEKGAQIIYKLEKSLKFLLFVKLLNLILDSNFLKVYEGNKKQYEILQKYIESIKKTQNRKEPNRFISLYNDFLENFGKIDPYEYTEEINKINQQVNDNEKLFPPPIGGEFERNCIVSKIRHQPNDNKVFIIKTINTFQQDKNSFLISLFTCLKYYQEAKGIKTIPGFLKEKELQDDFWNGMKVKEILNKLGRKGINLNKLAKNSDIFVIPDIDQIDLSASGKEIVDLIDNRDTLQNSVKNLLWPEYDVMKIKRKLAFIVKDTSLAKNNWFFVYFKKVRDRKEENIFLVNVHSPHNQNINYFINKNEDIINQVKKLINKLLQETKPRL